MLFSSPYRIYSSGDHSITIEAGNQIDTKINQGVISLFHDLSANRIRGIKDIIPAFQSLTLIYDIAICKKEAGNQSVFNFLSALIEHRIKHPIAIANTASRLINIPVCYDSSIAPDIALLAELHTLSIEELIEIHTGKEYRVYMIGFLPGFAYMGTVDQRIVTPRKSVPRTFVPAGSVGIAGEQTGIYPFGSAGGWQLIGRTPITMFDPKNENPCYLQPGDQVRFFSITLSEYKNWGQS